MENKSEKIINNDDIWVRCPCCRHKLFKKLVTDGETLIEIKCSSCKSVFTVLLTNKK